MLTIKELREKDAARLAAIKSQEPTPEEMETARHALRLYYRFVASYQSAFYTSQDRNATQAQRETADEKSEKAYTRASEALKPYGLEIRCPGLYPVIDYIGGACFTYGYFYN